MTNRLKELMQSGAKLPHGALMTSGNSMAKKSIHTGRSTHRLKDNPKEKVFAKAWREINEPKPGQSGPMTLDYMPAEDNNRPAGEVTERDAQVAATVIQWLGSPVGQHWLKETQAKAEKKSG